MQDGTVAAPTTRGDLDRFVGQATVPALKKAEQIYRDVCILNVAIRVKKMLLTKTIIPYGLSILFILIMYRGA